MERLLIILWDDDFLSLINNKVIFRKSRTVCTWNERALKPKVSLPPNSSGVGHIYLVALRGDAPSVVLQSGSLCSKGQPCLLCSSQCFIGRLRVMSQVTLPRCLHPARCYCWSRRLRATLLCSCRPVIVTWCSLSHTVTLLIRASVLTSPLFSRILFLLLSCHRLHKTEFSVWR